MFLPSFSLIHEGDRVCPCCYRYPNRGVPEPRSDFEVPLVNGEDDGLPSLNATLSEPNAESAGVVSIDKKVPSRLNK